MVATSISHLRNLGIGNFDVVDQKPCAVDKSKSSSKVDEGKNSKQGKNVNKQNNKNKVENADQKNTKEKQEKPTNTAAPTDKRNQSQMAQSAHNHAAPPKDQIPTELLYMSSLEETYNFELLGNQAKVIKVVSGEELNQVLEQEKEKGVYDLQLVLDRSIFHPQGGGQQTDEGVISVANKGQTYHLPVQMVKKTKVTGEVFHYVKLAEADSEAEKLDDLQKQTSNQLQEIKDLFQTAEKDGKSISQNLKIDGKQRLINQKLHSQGHLLDVQVQNLGFANWVPQKGYHFEDGPYVEYTQNGDLKQEKEKTTEYEFENHPKGKDQLCQQLQDKVKELILQEPEVGKGDSRVALEFKLGVRHVKFQGLGCGCGGTHVRRLREIVDPLVEGQEFLVTGIRWKKNTVRVSYKLKY